MDDVISETTSSISIQWCVFCTYIVSMLEMSPFKSVSITLVYTTFNYAPRTRHAAASPWCLLPLPVLAHAFADVAIGVWPQKWPWDIHLTHIPPRQQRTDEWAAQMGAWKAGRLCLEGQLSDDSGNLSAGGKGWTIHQPCTLWLHLPLLLHSISKGSPVVDQCCLHGLCIVTYMNRHFFLSYKMKNRCEMRFPHSALINLFWSQMSIFRSVI